MNGDQALREPTALVTGAASGIGAALARTLAAEGCKVAVSDVDGAAAAALADDLRADGSAAIGVELDVCDPAAWARAVADVEQALGPIEIFCSNAGVGGEVAPLTELRIDYFRWLLEVNVLGAAVGIQAVVPSMIERGLGRVLFTASMASLGAPALLADYAASKHALLAVADSLRQEVEPFGITVTALCPAAVSTNLGATTRRNTPRHLRRNAAQKARAEEMRARLSRSSGGPLSAEAVAQIAVAALRRGQFLAFTHPESGDRALARLEEARQAIRSLQHLSEMRG